MRRRPLRAAAARALGGKLGKQGGLTHKNRENSFTKPGGVMEDLLKEHWVCTRYLLTHPIIHPTVHGRALRERMCLHCFV